MEFFDLESFRAKTDDNKSNGDNDFSLDAIAKLHLSQTNGPSLNFGGAQNWNLNVINLTEDDNNESPLDTLAKLHLGQSDIEKSFLLPDLNFSPSTTKSLPEKEDILNFKEFKIPSLFDGIQKGTDNSDTNKTSEIDLTSALLQKSSHNKTEAKNVKLKDENLYIESTNILEEFGLLLPEQSGSRGQNQIRAPLRPSNVASVVCRQWDHCRTLLPVRKASVICNDIQPFRFDTPSPDDVVKLAQSKLFGRCQN
jgi:hypothetical protein